MGRWGARGRGRRLRRGRRSWRGWRGGGGRRDGLLMVFRFGGTTDIPVVYLCLILCYSSRL